MADYNPKEIEKKWQEEWEKSKIYEAKDFDEKPKYYSLMEFPYPSGDGLHTGHVRGYTAMDIVSRKRRMQGHNVIFPIGYDAFGLPTENFALKTGRPPAEITKENCANFEKQFRSLGMSFDWSRQVNTTDPAYYKWTQWLFLKFLEHGLAYKAKIPINWCPKDKIGLANEEVVDGKCERCGTPVEQREKEQWMLAITKYADRLLADLDSVDYPERVKAQQKNWIGKSEGALVKFDDIEVFTTRPDTIYGATFIVKAGKEDKFTGQYVTNPATKEKIPIWEAEYVLADYGTGAIMAVPAHDERDFEFAKKYSLPIKQVIKPIFIGVDSPPKEGAKDTERDAVIMLVKHWSEDKYLLDYSPEFKWKCLLTGGVEEGEDPLETVRREIQEEVGYKNIKSINYILLEHIDKFYAPHKGVNRTVYQKNVVVELADGEMSERTEEEKKLHQPSWCTAEEMREKITLPNHRFVFEAALGGGKVVTQEGVLMNSGEFDGTYTSGGSSQLAPRYIDSHDPPIPGKKTVKKKVAHAIIESPDGKKVLVLKWHNYGWVSFVSGGVEAGEDPQDAVIREIKEETGYTDIKEVLTLGKPFYTEYHAAHKGENREAEVYAYHVKLASEKQDAKAKLENEKFDEVWVTWEEARQIVNQVEAPEFWKRLNDVKKKITLFVGGKWVTTYKLRDWVFSRQRYWGEPIPVVWCEKDGWVPLPESELPLKLPEVKNYQPTDTGESPLANISEWVNTTCPKCGGAAKRETDTMPNWAGSSWYFLRYTDPKNDKEFASKEKLQYWTPVDWYNGGMEHTVLHLLYSRFWNKFLFDLKLVPTSEPYKKRTSHGIILASDGRKMSKSLGNVINPNAIVERLGADTLRLYEMFMGPFEQMIAWNDDALSGPRRFLEKVWKLKERLKDRTSDWEVGVNNVIKSVSDDIENLKFNTAVSSLMVYTNTLLENSADVSKKEYETLLKLLAPFAPHMAEELWYQIGNKDSVHTSSWPKYDANKLQASEVTVVVQVNGKVRSKFVASSTIGEAEAVAVAKALPDVLKWLGDKEVKKAHFVPGKLVNFVL